MKAQGALEYLIIIAAVLAISAIVVMFVTGAFGGTQTTADFSGCKAAAASCYSSHLLSPGDPCIQCDERCVDSAGNEIFPGAVQCCKDGLSQYIYDGSTECAPAVVCSTPADCDDTDDCTDDDCVDEICVNTQIAACIDGDNCCPSGCTEATDNDCAAGGPTCGNGGQEGTEVCDDGNNINCDGCNADCTRIDDVCGDGIIECGEECDGVEFGGADCASVMGDPGWTGDLKCDPVDCNIITEDCVPPAGPYCGDGVVDVGLGEQCDDGNTNNNDLCLNDCTLAACGDGIVCTSGCTPLEECDDGNMENTDSCLSFCEDAECGDGYVWAGIEECDDGNSNNGDGCSSTCTIEP